MKTDMGGKARDRERRGNSTSERARWGEDKGGRLDKERERERGKER